jgi:hypothetical protein
LETLVELDPTLGVIYAEEGLSIFSWQETAKYRDLSKRNKLFTRQIGLDSLVYPSHLRLSMPLPGNLLKLSVCRFHLPEKYSSLEKKMMEKTQPVV